VVGMDRANRNEQQVLRLVTHAGIPTILLTTIWNVLTVPLGLFLPVQVAQFQQLKIPILATPISSCWDKFSFELNNNTAVSNCGLLLW
jgi:hypothetical protein